MEHACISPDRSDDTSVALAKHAIRLLETRLEEKYQVHVVLGAEMEFTVLPKGNTRIDGMPFGLNGDIDRHDGNPSSMRHDKDPLFPYSRRVNRTYREQSNPDSPRHKLEVVLTHRPADKDGELIKTDALTLARCMEATRSQIEYMGTHPAAEPGKPTRSGYKKPDAKRKEQHQGWLAFAREHVDRVRFTPFLEYDHITSGMQVNCSLVDRTTGEPLFGRPHMVDHMRNGLGDFFRENLYLLGSDYHTLQRWTLRYQDAPSYYEQFKVKHPHEKPHQQHIENGLPPADANPYYTMMLQLAGLCHVLEQDGLDRETEARPAQDFSQLTPATLFRDFHKGTKLRTLLNEMESGLGDRFVAAVDQTPPGHERSAQQKLAGSTFIAR